VIPGGYILQPRIIDGSDLSGFPPVTRELWHYLLRNVNHARNERLNIDRGQGFFRLSDIQDDLKWYSGYRKNIYSKPQLTKSLRRLREGNMVATAKETRGLLITICNYDYYQDPENYEGNGEETAKGSRKKSKGRTINKNGKNNKNENKDKPFRALDFLIDLGVEKQIASDFLEVRKGKNQKPTLTAFNTIKLQIAKTKKTPTQILKICIDKGWAGFRASWKYDDSQDQEQKGGVCGKSCFNHPTCLATNKTKTGEKCGGFSSEATAGRR
jgi:hypothetical protein